MNNLTSHTLHAFDTELDKLHSLLFDMIDLLVIQLEQSIFSLENLDVQYADNAITLDKEIDRYETRIDAEVLVILAKFSPVANDLRAVISITKMSVELEKIGDELAGFAAMIIQAIDSGRVLIPAEIVEELTKICHFILLVFGKLKNAFETEQADSLYGILEEDRLHLAKLHQNIQHLLISSLQNNGNVDTANNVMQMNKVLEICGSQCRHIAEYMIFMIDRIDVRHQQ